MKRISQRIEELNWPKIKRNNNVKLDIHWISPDLKRQNEWLMGAKEARKRQYMKELILLWLIELYTKRK